MKQERFWTGDLIMVNSPSSYYHGLVGRYERNPNLNSAGNVTFAADEIALAEAQHQHTLRGTLIHFLHTELVKL